MAAEVGIKLEPEDEKIPLNTLGTQPNSMVFGEDPFIKVERLCQDMHIERENIGTLCSHTWKFGRDERAENEVKRELEDEKKPIITDMDSKSVVFGSPNLQFTREPSVDEEPNPDYRRIADENLQLRTMVEDLQSQLHQAESGRRGCCVM